MAAAPSEPARPTRGLLGRWTSPRDPDRASDARRWAGETARDIVDEDDLRLCVGELFANVCVHTDTAWIEIRITCDGDVLHVEVIDDGQRKPTSPMREGGRGFQIVGALTLGWGITYGSYTAAWFTMKASPE